MGVAAYYRGSAQITKNILSERSPIEFEIIQRLNSIPKTIKHCTPLNDVTISSYKNGFVLECPTTGQWFYYTTIRIIMQRWNIHIYEYNNGVYWAHPN